jgi:hypothetical protein
VGVAHRRRAVRQASERKEKMIRNLKTLGLVTIAVLATSAMVASAAQAEVTFTSGETPEKHTATEIHGIQEGGFTENYFQLNSKQISCENLFTLLKGGTTGTDAELVLSAEYKHCGVVVKNAETGKHELSKPATINMNGCGYELKRPTFIEANTYTGKVDLSCEGVKGIVITTFAAGTLTEPKIPVCEAEISPGQTGLSHIVYHNKSEIGKKDDITATVTIEGIKYTNITGGCPDQKAHADGKYVTNLTLTSETHDFWLSGN